MDPFMRRFLAAIAGFILSAPAAAGDFAVSVTQMDNNLYKVDGLGIWALTRECGESSYQAEAALNAVRISFLASGAECEVKELLGPSIVSGTHQLIVTRESDTLFSTPQRIYLRTAKCDRHGYGAEAAFRARGSGGELVFQDGKACVVEEVLEPVSN
jgi:hypothetical protein